ncbi:MAG: putative molybdenum carrier protein [Rhodospirillales bacterium]
MAAGPALRKIVSGGQTGVDRAALDAARASGFDTGGWCPKGRRAEDGAIPAAYPLDETETADYEDRTRLNVRDSDATLIITRGPLAGGALLTAEEALKLGRPHRVADLDQAPDPRASARWIGETGARVLNVAGPRESEAPGITDAARAFLTAVLALIRPRS